MIGVASPNGKGFTPDWLCGLPTRSIMTVVVNQKAAAESISLMEHLHRLEKVE